VHEPASVPARVPAAVRVALEIGLDERARRQRALLEAVASGRNSMAGTGERRNRTRRAAIPSVHRIALPR
jgi:hypothetical protein